MEVKRTWQKLLNQQPGRKTFVNYFQKARALGAAFQALR